MNLHVFNDAHGFISDLTVKRITTLDPGGQHLFLNLTATTIFRNQRMQYVTRNTRAYQRAIDNLPLISTIIFYPLDYVAAVFFAKFRKKQPSAKAVWVFWSYEYYHRPDRIMQNLDYFSTEHVNSRKGILQLGRQMLAGVARKLAGRPQFETTICNQAYAQISTFYSFLPQDYKNVSAAISGAKFSYRPISFLSIEEITQGIPPGPATLTQEIMVGHSASPSINHFEILKKLAALGTTQPILLPLEYGDLDYGRKIKSKAAQFFSDSQLKFLDSRLSMTAYYQRLSSVGFAVFNFRWQEALGNILFLIWNGSKVFMRDDSSVYEQFRGWGIQVFSLGDLEFPGALSELLSAENQRENRRIVEQLFNEEIVRQYWRTLVHTPVAV